MTSIGERIITVRGRQTQAVFAEKIKISPNALRSYEKGRALPNQAVLKSICKQFAVSPAWLLMGEGPMERTPEPRPRQYLDRKLLFTVVETLEAMLHELGKEPAPAVRAELVCLLYEFSSSDDAKAVKLAAILRLIKGALAGDG